MQLSTRIREGEEAGSYRFLTYINVNNVLTVYTGIIGFSKILTYCLRGVI